MKKFLVGSLIGLILVAGGLSVVAARFVPTIRPNTQVGPVPVGGLTREDAQKRLRLWWESEKTRELTLTSDKIRTPLPRMTPGKLGIGLDDVSSIAQCELNDFWESAQEKVTGSKYEAVKFAPKFRKIDANFDGLKKMVREAIGTARPAQIRFEAGIIRREPEVTSYQLDADKISDTVVTALEGNGEVPIPIIEAPKRVPDEELEKITEVVSEFSTRFPAYQTSRNTNIRLASSKLNGQVLMPGDRLSFNDTVGRRTAAGGYRSAPVLVNGMHDTGIGGGICQVSTTLYNASLFADLKIVRRNNHSIPSVYVPVGRDATVDYGNLDLIIENNQSSPIAVVASYENGRITFRILGQKPTGREVKILTSGHRSWGNGVKTVVDRSLPPGKTRIVEKGSSGHSITTYRVVYENGVEVRREVLNRSYYRGSPRIIAVNNAPKPVTPKPEAGATPITVPNEVPSPTTPGDFEG